jgi:hypothetical protein
MIAAVPVARLFGTHLTVADLDRSVTFCRAVGLSLALKMADRSVVAWQAETFRDGR